MHRQIGERAGHRLLAEAMSHVDYGAEDLERLESERRAEQRRKFGGGAPQILQCPEQGRFGMSRSGAAKAI